MIPIPRDYQMDQYHRLRARRAEGKRIIVAQAATGAGKSCLACYMAGQAVNLGKHVLFMVHLRGLVDQMSGNLRKFQIEHGVIMRGEHNHAGAMVQVASRDTLVSRAIDNQWIGMPQADLIFVDEGRHAWGASSDYRKILEYYPRATIILLDATPAGPDGSGMGPWAQAIECALPTSQLVQQGYLVPVKCYAPDRKIVKGKVSQRKIAGDLVESWKMYGENSPTVLFTSRVEYSRDAVEEFFKEGIKAVHVDADTKDEDRQRYYDELANGNIKIVSNVGIVGEGVDIPVLGCVQIYMNLDSRNKFLQMCGRMMRPMPGKSTGILIDHSGCVFRCGFPDEDQVWPLQGNVDTEYREKCKDKDRPDKPQYCKHCSLVYHGTVTCPQCGRKPVKPPKTIFNSPPIEHTNEPLTEAERGGERGNLAKDWKVKLWLACLGVAVARDSTFKMAMATYHAKTKGEWPGNDFPCMPSYDERGMKVADKYPNYGRRANAGE